MAQTGSLSMETEDIGPELAIDLSGLCRMCACICSDSGDPALRLTLESTLTEKLDEYLNIKVAEDHEYLPKQVCRICYDAVNHWSAVKETVKHTEEFYYRQVELHMISNSVIPKIEPSSPNSEPEGETEEPQYECSTCHEIFANLEYLNVHQDMHNRSLIQKRTRYPSRSNKYDYSLEPKCGSSVIKHTATTSITPPQRDSIILPTPSASIVVTPIMDELSHIDTTNFPCGKCPMTFEIFDDFAQHTQTHSYLREIPCGICGSYFRNKRLLLQHVLEHRTNPEKQVAFTCDMCSNVYSSRKNLLAHFSYRHASKTALINNLDNTKDPSVFTCGTCKQSFNGLTEFAQHFPEKHSVFYELACGVCDARFKRLPNLLNHEQLHKANPGKDISYRCPHCEKVFSEQRNLSHHLQVKHPSQSSNDKKKDSEESNSDPTDISVYTCGGCKVVYKDLEDFTQHFSRVHPSFHQLPCGICGVQFRKLHCLIQHEHLHRKLPNEQITFPCGYCEKKFSASRHLHQHMIRHHPDCEFFFPNKDPIPVADLGPVVRPTMVTEGQSDYQTLADIQGTSKEGFTCNECHEIFYNQTEFNKHSLKHVFNRCPCCHLSFERKRLLTIHMRDYHPNYKNIGKTLPCPVCGKLFKAAQTLKVHIELHSSERNYVCEICAKSYRSLSTLYKHKQSHADKPKFMCEFCQRTFTFKAAMKKHIMLHVNYLPFKCKDCGKRFTGLGLLKNHKIKKHYEGTPHHCIRCRKGFKDSRNWRRHMRTVCRVPLEEIPYVRDRQFIKHSYHVPTPPKDMF